MSAETLRRAAALMRERAEAASSSPWGVAVVDGMGFAVHRGEHDTISLYSQRQDAQHIASWHPAVALAVADWLDGAAARTETKVRLGGNDDAVWSHERHALAVARAYLGEQP